MGDADKNRDFVKHVRETMTMKLLALMEKEEQRESNLHG
jgi:hypothetical protein